MFFVSFEKSFILIKILCPGKGSVPSDDLIAFGFANGESVGFVVAELMKFLG